MKIRPGRCRWLNFSESVIIVRQLPAGSGVVEQSASNFQDSSASASKLATRIMTGGELEYWSDGVLK
jgi:hypothetical protein